MWWEYVGYDVGELMMSPVSLIQPHDTNHSSVSEHPVTCHVIKVTQFFFDFLTTHPAGRALISDWLVNSYRPQRSCEAYVFTSVCLSTGGGGVSASVHAGMPPRPDTPPGADPPDPSDPPSGSRLPPRVETPRQGDPPWQGDPPGKETPLARRPPGKEIPQDQTPPGTRPPQDTTTAADGTHPTGMHSCFIMVVQ